MVQMLAGIAMVWGFGAEAARWLLQVWPQAGEFGGYAAQFLVFCAGCSVVGVLEKASNPGNGPGGWASVQMAAQRVIAGLAIALLFGTVLGRLFALIAADLVPSWGISWRWPGRAVAFLLGTSLGWAVPTIATLGIGNVRRSQG